MKCMPCLTDGKIESRGAAAGDATVSTIFHFALFRGFDDVSKAILGQIDVDPFFENAVDEPIWLGESLVVFANTERREFFGIGTAIRRL